MSVQNICPCRVIVEYSSRRSTEEREGTIFKSKGKQEPKLTDLTINIC